MGQERCTSVDYSSYSKSIQAGFTELYFLDRNMALGFDIFRQDMNSFNYYSDNSRNTTYSQVRTGVYDPRLACRSPNICRLACATA